MAFFFLSDNRNYTTRKYSYVGINIGKLVRALLANQRGDVHVSQIHECHRFKGGKQLAFIFFATLDNNVVRTSSLITFARFVEMVIFLCSAHFSLYSVVRS